ncbi:unknown protein [Oryza sativa Japonica Group]|uniref:Os01g0525800 protein n=1 Tax=Oryza sativa subsp. japonica TaxID=39947 RepID=C7IW91_ORYSJ|nr:unknown protein [Oryza sativa Japonica Group]BAD73801.1 unknown protein [Oryza sativa Japonica Group]BAH91119.1 Os01g0525800 [Oryza sativa Japonica Group]|eukprot:NP_001172389.1 Os01g0525800 [Oryza sativa Japonica Group]
MRRHAPPLLMIELRMACTRLNFFSVEYLSQFFSHQFTMDRWGRMFVPCLGRSVWICLS